MDALEGAVSERDYLVGDTFSAADVYAGSQIGFGLMFEFDRQASGVRAVLAAHQREARGAARQADR
jgi:glutathione S-transferase